MRIPGHYVTVTGVRNGEVIYHDSLAENNADPEEQRKHPDAYPEMLKRARLDADFTFSSDEILQFSQNGLELISLVHLNKANIAKLGEEYENKAPVSDEIVIRKVMGEETVGFIGPDEKLPLEDQINTTEKKSRPDGETESRKEGSENVLKAPENKTKPENGSQKKEQEEAAPQKTAKSADLLIRLGEDMLCLRTDVVKKGKFNDDQMEAAALRFLHTGCEGPGYDLSE